LGSELSGADDSKAHRIPAVVAPFDRDPLRGAARAFDRGTGEAIAIERLRTYREVLAQYHLHPETKFENGEYLDSGPTRRRHVRPLGPIGHIGKEANRWEEQFFLGANPETQVVYGIGAHDAAAYADRVRSDVRACGVRPVSREAGVSVGQVSKFLTGLVRPSIRVLRGIDRAVWSLGRSSTLDRSEGS
jgi:hypothetical protein